MATITKYEDDAHRTCRERKEFGGSYQKCLIAMSSTLAIMLLIYSAIDKTMGVGGLAPRKDFTIKNPTMPENAPLEASLASFNL